MIVKDMPTSNHLFAKILMVKADLMVDLAVTRYPRCTRITLIKATVCAWLSNTSKSEVG